MSENLSTLIPSRSRRLFGAGLFIALGVLLLFVAVTEPLQGVLPKIILPVLGVFFLWRAAKNWKATEQGLVLRREGIFDLDGRVICAFDNIASVERGLLSFKPSNGFLIRMAEPMERSWIPGLYWRYGRKLGVGGATSAGDSKQMADSILVLLAERTGAS